MARQRPEATGIPGILILLAAINRVCNPVQRRLNTALHELVDQAYYKSQIVVAAANNQQQVSFPAHFASLVAVDNQSFEDPLTIHYRLGQPIEFAAHGIYVKAPSPGGKFRWYTGTSFACPHVTGLVARLVSQFSRVTPYHVKSLLVVPAGKSGRMKRSCRTRRFASVPQESFHLAVDDAKVSLRGCEEMGLDPS